MKETFRTTAKKIIIALAGIVLIAFAIAIYLETGLGADPASVLVTGLCRVLSAPYFVGSIIINAAFLILALCMGRWLIGIATVMSLFILGPVVDLCGMYLLPVFAIGNQPMVLKILIAVLATVIIGFGISLYLSPGLGSSPCDLVAILLTDYIPIPFRYVRIIVDGAMLVSGFLMGSESVGIVTFIGAAMFGPVINLFNPVCRRLTDRYTGRSARK